MKVPDVSFLSEDVRMIKEALLEQQAYSFPAFLEARMNEKALSSSELGRRCGVSHTIVDRWKKGTARPNGKERMKELGMALGMDKSELNTFLYMNGYPMLSSRNPYDSAARLLLMRCAGDPDIVAIYRRLIDSLALAEYQPRRGDSLTSAVMSMKLEEVGKNSGVGRWLDDLIKDRLAGQQPDRDGAAEAWFRNYQKEFLADDKNVALSKRLMQFILLYIGVSAVKVLSETGELPASLRNLLYAVLSGKGIAVRFLREKLICLGLYLNMTEEEIDLMLNCAGLRHLSDPVSREDMAVLIAVRCGHEEYPYYEYDNIKTVISRLDEADPGEAQLLAEYRERLALSEQLVKYYESCTEHRGNAPASRFEELYTSYSDKGLMDYVHDILYLLQQDGCLNSDTVRCLLEYTERTEGGESIWN